MKKQTFTMVYRLNRRRHPERSGESQGRHEMLRYSLSMTTAFTMADRRSSASEQRVECRKHATRFLRVEQDSRFHILGRKLAFTMAEILISLTIIGIIAAVTLPSLIGNINGKTWTTQRKALYSRMSQAISMMPSLNGYGVVFENGSINETATANKAAQAFITDVLSKVLKISNVCDGSSVENLKKCGFPDKFKKMGNGAPKLDTPTTLVDLCSYFGISNSNIVYSQINTNAAAFETVNGESVLTFYNPNCSYTYGVNNTSNPTYTGQQNLMQPTMCANFIYDLNGRKGPNQVGKDIGFMTAFYPTDSEFVMPMPIKTLSVKDDGQHPQFSIGYGNLSCRKNFGNDARMANIEELKSVFTNNTLGYYSKSSPYFISSSERVSSTMLTPTRAYTLSGILGRISTKNLSYGTEQLVRVFCVKK